MDKVCARVDRLRSRLRHLQDKENLLWKSGDCGMLQVIERDLVHKILD